MPLPTPVAPRVSLYHMPISHYCVCAERTLAFKGVAAEIVPVPYHDKRSLIAATGQDYVPAMVWDGRVVPWTEIGTFLEEQRPTPTLYPYENRGLAEALDEWGHTQVEERVWRYVVTRVPPILSDEVERWVFEEIQHRVRGPWSQLESRRDEFRKDLEPTLARIDRMLDGRAWILGSPSLADFGIYGGLSPLFTVGEGIPEGFPRLAAWIDRVRRVGTAPSTPAAPPGRSPRPASRSAPSTSRKHRAPRLPARGNRRRGSSR